jgi:hypothetical protein
VANQRAKRVQLEQRERHVTEKPFDHHHKPRDALG